MERRISVSFKLSVERILGTKTRVGDFGKFFCTKDGEYVSEVGNGLVEPFHSY
jgi:hypothetical protein